MTGQGATWSAHTFLTKEILRLIGLIFWLSLGLSLLCGWALVGAEVVAHFGSQAPVWFVATTTMLVLGGVAVWQAARGRGPGSLRSFCLLVTTGLAFLAWLQWPGVRETRHWDALLNAEIRLSDARRSRLLDDRLPSLFAAERDVAVARARISYEQAIQEVGADYRRERRWILLTLAGLWVVGAFASRPLYFSLTK